jgi:glycine/D-amino acid oxidase-like deaminating enzyme
MPAMNLAWTLDRPAQRLEVDVLVLGGGCAGTVAAVAAARTGASVVLVERDGTLGGVSTGVLDTFYGFYRPQDATTPIVGGLPLEVVERLLDSGSAFARPNTYGAGTGITYNPEVLRTLWDAVCAEAGVRVLLGTVVVDVRGSDGRPEELLLAAGSELLQVRATAFVDASGDGVLAHLAGAESEGFSDIPNPQSLTTTFTMAPVDQAALADVGRAGLVQLLQQAAQDGYALPRLEGSLHATTAPGVEFVHMTRVAARDPREPSELSAAEAEGRAQVQEYARFLRDRVPGFEQAQISWMSRRIGVREARRVRGRYWLTREDVLGGRQFDDTVALGAAPIEDHGSGTDTRWEYLETSSVYGIPLRCLQPVDLPNVLIAGRCLSASHDAHASARNMAQCMATGQAAGTAAALASRSDGDSHALPAQEVREALRQSGALLAEPVHR